MTNYVPSFSNSINSYGKRKLEKSLSIGISPIFFYRSLVNTAFNSLSEGLISVVVTSTESLIYNNKEIWNKLVSLIQDQIPEGYDIKEMPLDKILEIVNFRKLVEISKFIENQVEFNEKIEKKLDTLIDLIEQQPDRS